LKQKVSELTLKYGALLEPLDALGPAMTTLGPIMIAFSSINFTKVIPSITSLSTALWANPIFLIAGVIVAVIATLVILEKKFGLVTKTIDIVSDALFGFIEPITEVIYAFENWREILGIVTDVFNSIIEYITGLYSKFKEMGINLIKHLISGVKEKISELKNLISDALSDVRDLFPFSPAKTGPLTEVPDWSSYLINPVKENTITANNSGMPATNSISITITGNYIKDDYDVERIADEIMSKLDNLR
jgi:hypothetical protein